MAPLSEDVCQKHLYPLTLTLFASVYSVALLCAFFGLTPSLLWFAILFPLLMLPIHFLSVNGKPFLFFLVFLPLSVLVGYLFIRTIGSFNSLIQTYSEWWATQNADLLPPYLLFLLLPATLVISLLYLLQRNYISRLITAVLEFAVLLAFTFTKQETGKVAVIFFLGSLFFLVLETTLRFTLRKQTGAETAAPSETISRAPAHTFQLWPVVLLSMLLLTVIPHADSPIRWNYVKTIWNNVANVANDAFQFIRIELFHLSSDFTLKFSGYSNSGKLGGELFQTNTDSLHVVSTKRKVDSVYLSGNSKNLYTGSSWENELLVPDSLTGYSDSYLDAAELAYAVVRSGNYQDHENLYLDNEYAIKFLDYRSTTLFTAMKTKEIQLVHPFDIDYLTLPDCFQFDRKMKKDTFYRVRFNQPNLGSQEFLNLATSSAYPYNNSFHNNTEDMVRFRADYNELPDGAALDALLLSRKNMIYDNYLALPDSVTERVYALASALTESQTSDYEKMRVLESYLQTLTYTTSPDTPPDDQDLTDFFLFDSPRGYCTYFATALSVLGRCAGIPTRYVQGYCTRVTSHYQWTLRSKDAHAWTEAYIDGLGWIPFDATPGYSAYRYQPWYFDRNATPTPVPDSLPDWWNATQNLPISPTPSADETETGSDWLIAFPIIIGSLLTFLLILAVYIIYRSLKLRHFLRHSAQEDLFYYDSTQIFVLYGLLNDITKTEQLFSDVTLYEFTTNFVQAYPEVYASALRFCNHYSAVRYGTHLITQEYCNDLITYKSQLLTLLAEKKGKHKVLQYRITRLFRQ